MPGSRAPVKSTCEQGLSTQPVITSGVYVLFIKVAYFPICVSTITVLQRKYTRSSNASNYTDFDLRISHAYSKLFLNEKIFFYNPHLHLFAFTNYTQYHRSLSSLLNFTPPQASAVRASPNSQNIRTCINRVAYTKSCGRCTAWLKTFYTPDVFWKYFPNGREFLTEILHLPTACSYPRKNSKIYLVIALISTTLYRIY